VGVKFSAPIQNCPGAHPSSCTVGTESFLGWLGHGIDHPPPSSAKVKERLELCLYSSWGLQGKLYFFNLSLWNENISSLISHRSWVDSGRLNSKKPKLISQVTWFTPLTNIYLRLVIIIIIIKKLCVCVREKHLILYAKLSKYNLHYLWSVFCLLVMYTKLTIITVMWGLKCTYWFNYIILYCCWGRITPPSCFDVCRTVHCNIFL
jgi:hypothetical protein